MKFLEGFLLISIVVLAGCTAQTEAPQTQEQTPASEQPESSQGGYQESVPAPTTPSGSGTLQGEVTSPTPASTITEYKISIMPSGFSPKELTIKKGDTVIFTNNDSSQHWPASDVHPTHTLYPESGGCIGSKFDACKGLKQGEQYTFTFSKAGNWCYHDHLNPGTTGCINVQ